MKVTQVKRELCPKEQTLEAKERWMEGRDVHVSVRGTSVGFGGLCRKYALGAGNMGSQSDRTTAALVLQEG